VIESGWDMSPKQQEALDKIMKETDFLKLQEAAQKDQERFQEVLELIEVLDKVKFGFYPTDFYISIRNQFAKNGALSDKQVDALKKLKHRFRKQIEKM
jgi:endonuclease/exonuclease/phosphatase family metal-dependent hydrolase